MLRYMEEKDKEKDADLKTLELEKKRTEDEHEWVIGVKYARCFSFRCVFSSHGFIGYLIADFLVLTNVSLSDLYCFWVKNRYEIHIVHTQRCRIILELRLNSRFCLRAPVCGVVRSQLLSCSIWGMFEDVKHVSYCSCVSLCWLTHWSTKTTVS